MADESAEYASAWRKFVKSPAAAQLATLSLKASVAGGGVQQLKTQPPAPDRLYVFVGHGRAGKDEACRLLGERCRSFRQLDFIGTVSTSNAATDAVAAALDVSPETAYRNRHACREFWKVFCNMLRDHYGSTILARRALQMIADSRDLRADDRLSLDRCSVVAINGFRNFRELVTLDTVPSKLCEVVWVDRPGTPLDPTLDYSAADYLKLARTPKARQNFHWLVNDGDLEALGNKVEGLLHHVECRRGGVHWLDFIA